MNPFSGSSWIWLKEGQFIDQYAEFTQDFDYDGKSTVLYLSVDTDYALFLNGEFVCSNQYGDFEHYKVYDTIDLSSFCRAGKNTLTFVVYYCGASNSRYKPYSAGLIFALTQGGITTRVSSPEVLSRLHPKYESGNKVLVTSQLGFTFAYDATRPETEFSPSAEVVKNCNFISRPIKKSAVLPKAEPKSVVKLSDTDYLIDLGGETVGLPTLSLNSPEAQTFRVSWGEVLVDGHVRATVGDRTFTFTYKATAGENSFTEYMLRLGCRYLEIRAEKPFTLLELTILPQVYEVESREVFVPEPYRAIYEASLKTLRCSMMEHYVDCPWREQALYACDSKNQMLCGYYAFKDGNADYAKANLTLMGEDRREDGLLSICYPCGIPLTIPSFTLHYIYAMQYYYDFTADKDFIVKYMPKMTAIVDAMLKNSKDDLVMKFEGKDSWNFYEWTKYSDGTLFSAEAVRADLAINCLTIIALDTVKYLCEKTGVAFNYAGVADKIRLATKKAFFSGGAFVMHENTDEYTVLGNSLAILAGLTTKQEAEIVAKRMTSGEFVDCSISMKLMYYNALLSVSEDYEQFILDEILKDYTPMLEFGHDTVWETVGGWRDFRDAGSLCHGWSAIPIYFFHKFGIATYKENK